MADSTPLTNGIFLNGFANSHSLQFLHDKKLTNPISSFPADGSNLTIVILSFNRVSFTIRLINSLIKHVPNFNGRVLIMDNGSNVEQLELLENEIRAFSQVKIDVVKLGKNFGVAGGRNKAMEFVETEWFMSLDNDIYFIDNPLPAIKECIEKLGVLFLNVPLLQVDGKHIDAFGGNLWMEPCEDSYFVSGTSTFRQMHVNDLPKIDAFISTFLFGGASVLNKEAFIRQGCYDDNMFIGFEDTELSLRLTKQGIKIGNANTFSFIHAHESPKNKADIDAEKARFSARLIRESGEYFRKKHNLIVWRPSVDSWIEEKFKELSLKEETADNKNLTPLNEVKKEISDLARGGENILNSLLIEKELRLVGEVDSKEFEVKEAQLKELQQKLAHVEYQLNMVEESKFWKMRSYWFRQRRKLGINDDGTSFSLLSLIKGIAKANLNPEPYNYDNLLKKVKRNKGESNVMVFIPFMVVGGAETAILQVLKGFAKAKVNTTLIVENHPTTNSGDTSADFIKVCDDTYVLENYNALWNDTDSWKHWKNITYALIKRRRINTLLISNSSFAYLLLEDIKKDFPHIKIINPVYSIVGHMVDNIKHSEKIDLTIVENPLVEAYLIKDALRSPERVRRIENGVDVKRYKPGKTKKIKKINNEVIPDKKIVSFLGRLSVEKGPDLFLEIAAILKDRDDVHFVLAGDGPMRVEIIEQIDRLGLKNKVTFLGFANSVEVLGITDILILPSRMDGRPNVVLESLAIGVPVIASNVGGLPWIINENNGNGYLCSPQNLDSFKNAINNLLDDDMALKKMKQTAREYAIRELNVASMQQAYINICKYRNI